MTLDATTTLDWLLAYNTKSVTAEELWRAPRVDGMEPTRQRAVLFFHLEQKGNERVRCDLVDGPVMMLWRTVACVGIRRRPPTTPHGPADGRSAPPVSLRAPAGKLILLLRA
jgi:hypothetical protein